MAGTHPPDDLRPDWATIPRLLLDLRSVTDTTTIGEPEMRQALAQLDADRQILAGQRNAILAGREFSKASRYSRLAEHYGMDAVVFNNLDTACLFLNINVQQASHILDELRAALHKQR